MDSSLELSNSLPARHRTFKVIVVGDSGVGKTCLTHRFCAREFPGRTEATIGVDFRERMVDIEGEKIKLQLWDTAGQERFRKSMVQHYYRSVHAVLFVYDVSCPASFRGLPAWIEECRQNSLGYDVPRLLVGNKCDLRAVGAVGQVSREQALKFAKAHGMMLFETSAKSPLNKGMNGRGGGGGGGGGGESRDGDVSYHQDKVEAIVTALAVRLKRQKRSTAVDTRGMYESFKIPVKKRPEKDLWVCTC